MPSLIVLLVIIIRISLAAKLLTCKALAVNVINIVVRVKRVCTLVKAKLLATLAAYN
jgi:hypothetical protein